MNIQFKRIAFPGDPEVPIAIETLMKHGVPGQYYTGIVAYDELFNLIKEASRVMTPFIAHDVSPSVPDDALITVRIPAKAFRDLIKSFKGVTL